MAERPSVVRYLSALGSGGARGRMARRMTPSGSRQIDGGSAVAGAGLFGFFSCWVRFARVAPKSTSSLIAATSSYWIAALSARKANHGAVTKQIAATASDVRKMLKRFLRI